MEQHTPHPDEVWKSSQESGLELDHRHIVNHHSEDVHQHHNQHNHPHHHHKHHPVQHLGDQNFHGVADERKSKTTMSWH